MLRISGLTKTYGPSKALTDFSIDFPEHGLYGILGPSGSGKTTLLNLIAALDRPDQGRIEYQGKDVTAFSPKQADIYRHQTLGFIYQDCNLLPNWTVLENVLLPARISPRSKTYKARAISLLSSLGIDEAKQKRKPDTLSGGEKQRVAIARALLLNPPLLLADEPTGSLNQKKSAEVMAILSSLKKDHLILLVSHNEALAQRYCDGLVQIEDGHLTASPAFPEATVSVPTKDTATKRRFFSFLPLSFAELFHQKRKTLILTCISVLGFLSVTTTLSLRSGTLNASDKIQREALNGTPLTCYSYLAGTGYLFASADTSSTIYPTDNHFHPASSEGQGLTHVNNLSPSFIAKSQAIATSHDAVQTLSYAFTSNILTKKTDGSFATISAESGNLLSDYTNLFLGESKVFSPLTIPNAELLNSYDVLSGHLPEKDDEAICVVNRANQITSSFFNAIGLEEGVSFEKLFQKEIKFYSHDEFYHVNTSSIEKTGYFLKSAAALEKDGYCPLDLASLTADALLSYYAGNSEATTAKVKVIESLFTSDKETRTLKSYSPIKGNSDLTALFDDSTKGSPIHVCGVIRPKKGSYFQSLNSGLYLSPALVSKLAQSNSSSGLAQEIPNHLILPEKTGQLAFPDVYAFTDRVALLDNSDYEAGLENVLQHLIARQCEGTDSALNAIVYYPKSVAAKNAIIADLDAYNASQTSEYSKVFYTDMVGAMVKTLNSYLVIVEWVLMALAIFSFVFSCFLLGLTMTNEVKDKRRAIGLYRSFGFSRTYVVALFLGEAIGLSLLSAFVGLALTYALLPLLNYGIGLLDVWIDFSHFASLGLGEALIVVLFLVFANLMGSLFPALSAGRVDPIKALRDE